MLVLLKKYPVIAISEIQKIFYIFILENSNISIYLEFSKGPSLRNHVFWAFIENCTIYNYLHHALAIVKVRGTIDLPAKAADEVKSLSKLCFINDDA